LELQRCAADATADIVHPADPDAGLPRGAAIEQYDGIAKEAKLVHKAGAWYCHLVLDLIAEAPRSGGVLAVDLGRNNIAATSTGRVFGGGQLRDNRD